MGRPLSLAYLFTFLFWTVACWAGKYNSDRNIGESAPSWTDLPGVDGKMHSSTDFKQKDVLVVAFTCNSCPYAVDYENRLVAFAKKHAPPESRVGLVAINVNTVADDLLPAMKERANAKGYQFTYLFDESQRIAREFGATRTPEFFVLDKQRKIIYMGAMDDNSDESKVKHRHVEDAVSAALAGKTPEKAETPPVGCGIRFARSRQKK